MTVTDVSLRPVHEHVLRMHLRSEDLHDQIATGLTGNPPINEIDVAGASNIWSPLGRSSNSYVSARNQITLERYPNDTGQTKSEGQRGSPDRSTRSLWRHSVKKVKERQMQGKMENNEKEGLDKGGGG